jgi:hypothetical protein
MSYPTRVTIDYSTAGAQGPAGADGADGAAGSDGAAGADGAAGSDGVAGAAAEPFNPIITVLGSPNMTISQSKAATYVDGGASAVNSDSTENLTGSITTTGAVSTTPALYTITYTVMDSYERSSTAARKVRVV